MMAKILRNVVVTSLIISLCNACEFELQVFDGPNEHGNPFDSGTIITDGTCRSLGSSSTTPFPGYYRATCDSEFISFSVSGCEDPDCTQCERNARQASTLYSTLPVTIHPPPSAANGNAQVVDVIVNHLDTTIYFAAYGACGQCPVVVPAPPPSLRPTTRVETYTLSPTLSPVRTTAAAAPFTFAPVDRPTRPDTDAPTREEEEEESTNNENTLSPPAPIRGVSSTTAPTTGSSSAVVSTPTSSPTATKKASSAASSVVYGASIGSVVVLLALGLLLFAYRRRNHKPKGEDGVARGDGNVDDKATDSENSRDVIVLLNNGSGDEDMSTLGGYTATNNKHAMTRDEQASVFEDPTASVDVPFDYERNEYKATGRNTVGASTTITDFSNASALQRLGGLLRDDDENSFEQQFRESAIPQRDRRRRHWTSLTVQVPPGMVGMVVDNTDIPNEPPVVRALRPDSVLARQVKIGDRLLSVNGRDVTQIPAPQVSKMIAANQAQQTRTLVFARLVEENDVEG